MDHEFRIDTHLELSEDLFCWRTSPPTKLRHLTLYVRYGGPTLSIRNLTSFEFTGDVYAFNPMLLDQYEFLPFISGRPSLVSLCLSHCRFPDHAWSSRVTPANFPELKCLQLTDTYGLAGFPGLIKVPAFKTPSSLWISA